MPSRSIWDISPTLFAALPVWPRDTAFSSATRWAMSDSGPVRAVLHTLDEGSPS